MKHIFTANERIEITNVGGQPFIIPGRDYLVRASGDFGGGTLTVGYVEDTNYQALKSITEGGGFGIEFPWRVMYVELTGSSSPDLIFGIEAVRYS